MPLRVVVVEDEPPIRAALSEILGSAGFDVVAVGELSAGLRVARQLVPEAVLLDRRLPDGDGIEAIPALLEASGGAAIVVVTGNGEPEAVVRALRAGAVNFLAKPYDPGELVDVLTAEATKIRNARDAELLAGRGRRGLGALLGTSPAIEAVREQLSLAAPADASVLLLGESGSGKGVAAEALHAASPRHARPFVDINCAGLSSTLLESELFGYEKGAFTDARERKIGLLEAADRGTLFLDEIAEADPNVQARLLKVLEQRKLRRLGSVQEIAVDFRLVSATNRDLSADSAAGRFRSDLFWRIGVISIRIPPLRERREDVPLLATKMLAALVGGAAERNFSPGALGVLSAYEWPGNVRELRNVVERAAVLSRGPVLDVSALPAEVRSARPSLSPAEGPEAVAVRLESLESVVDRHVTAVYGATSGNVKRTAEILELSRSALYSRLRKLGIREEP